MRTQKRIAMRQIRTTHDLGSIIREERRAQGLTQTELAGFSGVGLTFISNLENGKRTAEVGKALQVAETLGLDIYVEKRV